MHHKLCISIFSSNLNTFNCALFKMCFENLFTVLIKPKKKRKNTLCNLIVNRLKHSNDQKISNLNPNHKER